MTSTRPNLDWLYAFTVFAEHLNFAQAARTLNLSQPALHVQIRKLSEQVGVTLYRRQGRRLILTDEGERVLLFAREICERSERFLTTLRGDVAQAPVVLCTGEGAYLYLLAELIASFDGSLRLLVRSAPHTLEAVQTAQAHIGVLPLRQPPDRLEAMRIASVGQQLVVPRKHPLGNRSHVDLTDLADQALIVPPPGRPHRTAIEQRLAMMGVPWKIAVEVTGWPLTLHFVRLGVGIALVNDFCTVTPDLVAIPFLEWPAGDYYAIRRVPTFFPSPEQDLWHALSQLAKPKQSGRVPND